MFGADVDEDAATTVEHGGTITVSPHGFRASVTPSSPIPTALGCHSASCWSQRDLNKLVPAVSARGRFDDRDRSD
jgi:hypothetical protein